MNHTNAYNRCWDGVNLDSEDHASHVAFPEGPISAGLQIFGTDCPASHPVRLPLLFMEIIWDTRPFNDPALWPTDGSQPFVFSMGDPTGFGQHADYLFGWEGDSLQKAMEVCTGGDGIPWNCPVLTTQDMETMNNCRQPNKIEEIVESQCEFNTVRDVRSRHLTRDPTRHRTSSRLQPHPGWSCICDYDRPVR